LGLFCANSTTFAKILEKFGQIFKTTKLVLKKEKKIMRKKEKRKG